MKKRTSKKKSKLEVCLLCHKQRGPSFVGFIVIGLVHDTTFVLVSTIKIISWPVHALSRLLAREAKKHTELRFLRTHTFWAVTIGGVVLFFSFALQNVFHHPAWETTLETARAGGVCPIWDAISSLTKVSKELEE